MSWLSGWGYRKPIYLTDQWAPGGSPLIETLVDFPVPVVVGNAKMAIWGTDADVGGHVESSSGLDIRFTASDGATLLPYEREHFTVSAGQAGGLFHVKIPSIVPPADTSPVVIGYMYYGKSPAVDGENAQSVWNSNYAGVYHFAKAQLGSLTPNPDSHLLDSTAYARDIVMSGYMALFSEDPLWSASLYQNTLFISALTPCSLVIGGVSSTVEILALVEGDSNRARAIAGNKYYRDGYLYADNPNPNGIPDPFDTLEHIERGIAAGQNLASLSVFQSHQIYFDEVRLSNVARSASWIYATFAFWSAYIEVVSVSLGNEQAPSGFVVQAPQNATFAVLAPTITANKAPTINAPCLNLTANALQCSAGVDHGVTQNVATQNANFEVLIPTIILRKSPSPTIPSINARFAIPSPTVQAQRWPTLSVTTQDAAFAVLAPTVTAARGVTINAPILELTAAILTPVTDQQAIAGVDEPVYHRLDQ